MPRVGELVILAAPSCCGKSHFLRQLQDGRLQSLARQLRLDAPVDSYVAALPGEAASYGDAAIPRMILHFAIPTIALNSGSLRNLADEPRLDVVKNSGRVIVITLLAGARVLSSRLRSRSRLNCKMIFFNFSRYQAERQRLSQLKELYASPERLVFTYERWLEYVRSLPNLDSAWLVTAERDYEAFGTEDWEGMKRSYFDTSRQNPAQMS